MAKKKDNTLLIVGVVGVGFYLWWKSKQSAALPVTTSASSQVVPSSTTVLSASPTIITTSTDDPRVTEINMWIATLPTAEKNAASAALSIMSSTEIDGLYDIVKNDFYGNGITTATQRDFWNTWRAKYNYP